MLIFRGCSFGANLGWHNEVSQLPLDSFSQSCWNWKLPTKQKTKNSKSIPFRSLTRSSPLKFVTVKDPNRIRRIGPSNFPPFFQGASCSTSGVYKIAPTNAHCPSPKKYRFFNCMWIIFPLTVATCHGLPRENSLNGRRLEWEHYPCDPSAA